MGVLVVQAVSQLRSPLVMGVLQMGRNRQISRLLHALGRLADGADSRVAFGSAGHIGGGVCQNDLCLRHAHALHGQRSADRHLQGLRVRISHILRRTDHDPPCDEGDAFSRIEHLCQIINRGVRVRASHALDERRNGIIMVIPRLIILHHPLLNALCRNVQRDVNLSVLSPGRGQNAQLHGVERKARISARHIRKKIRSFLLQNGPIGAHPLLFIGDGPAQKLFHVFFCQGLQFKDDGPGKQRSVHLKIGIFRGRSDQDHGAVLHKGKQIVLLSLIEAVDLIDEKNGFLPIHAKRLLRLGHHLFHILFPRHRGVDLREARAGGVGDHPGQRGLSRSGRAVENDASQLIRLDGAVKQLILSDDVLLPHHLLQRLRPQSGRQRRFLFLPVFCHICE